MAKRKPPWRKLFLVALAHSGNVTASAGVAGVERRLAYRTRDRSKAFREQWEDALDEATDLLEAAARQRGLLGVNEPVYYQGEQVGTVRRYSDTLLIFLLKAHRPKKFRDNHRVEHTSPDGGPVEIVATYEALEAKIMAMAGPDGEPDAGDGDDDGPAAD